MQPLENELDTALHFLGQLENENEKALKPAKMPYQKKKKIPVSPFLQMEGIQGEKVLYTEHEKGPSTWECRVRFSVGGASGSKNTCPGSCSSTSERT